MKGLPCRPDYLGSIPGAHRAGEGRNGLTGPSSGHHSLGNTMPHDIITYKHNKNSFEELGREAALEFQS